MKSIKNLCLSLLVLSVFTACYEDMDDVLRPASNLEIKNFIWRGMNDIYLYKAEVPALADDRFENQQELNEFLNTFSSPEDLFYNGFLAEDDEFSFLVSDYVELEKSLDGINVSNGMQYGLTRYSPDASEVLGYVRYVLPNTSAEAQGVKRGDLFNTVNGEQLTVDNYPRLLEPASYTIGLATIEDNVVTPTGETVTLQKEEYTSNPVYIAKTIETSSGTVGYLMYNGFTSTFDEELNNVFATFQAEGVTELVLDLRYNGGGSVETANDLSSMITGQLNGEIFYTEQWNPDYQEYLKENEPESLNNRFNNKINSGANINSLGLNRVFVLTTLRTASASELLINGLSPYIDVIQIGQRTTGKFQASTTLYDSPNFGRKGANTGHTYAIQPLIYKTLNANGVTDYFNGLPPDILILEDVENLGVLGNVNEPLLRTALNAIEGEVPAQTKRRSPYFEIVGESGMKELLYKKMFTEEEFPNLK